MKSLELLLSEAHNQQQACETNAPLAVVQQAVDTGFVKSTQQHGAVYVQWCCPHASIFAEKQLIGTRTITPRWSVCSTQTLMKRLGACHGQMLLAEYQSHGMGRRNRTWQSPPCTHLYATYAHLEQQTHAHSIGCVSLAVAVLVADLLQMFGVSGVRIKWPNDILINDKKVAGILIDSSLATVHAFYMGIGINCHAPIEASGIQQPWTVVDAHRKTPINRMLLAVFLYDMLSTQLPMFFAFGFSLFIDRWRQYDALAGKIVRLEGEKKHTQGRYLGINKAGQLLLKQENGIIEAYSSAVRCRVIKDMANTTSTVS